jgi:hypothetical protein
LLSFVTKLHSNDRRHFFESGRCYWTVKVTAVECAVDPAEATIVTVDVVAADDVPPELAGADGPDCGTAACGPVPPPQLCNAIPATTTKHKAPNLWMLLRPPPPRRTPANGNKSAQATVKPAEKGTDDPIKLATEDEVASVRVALPVDAPGVTESGAKLQVIPAGNPEQERATARSNDPFCAATLMVYAADCPRFTV